MAGPTIMITGATSGLGRAVAEELAGRGATVLVHGRDPERIDRTVAELGGDVRGYRADLASLAEVRGLADEVAAREERLDVLINNAGVATRTRQESADGIELDLAVNHLAHFVLTGRLLGLLERSAPARVVNVASAGQAPIDWDDPLLERSWEWFRAYAQSKLAQIMFTFELAGRIAPETTTVNAVHPASLMDTPMVRETFGRAMSTVEDGVGPVVRLATGDDVAGVSGRYFDRFDDARAHPQAYDADARRRLWRLSAELAGEDPYGG
jgi:NAD(P)-dependent dehydrogenase (short-subunit alcohol dehydrogenase family)